MNGLGLDLVLRFGIEINVKRSEMFSTLCMMEKVT